MTLVAMHTVLFGANGICSLLQIKQGNLRWAAAGIVAMVGSGSWIVNGMVP